MKYLSLILSTLFLMSCNQEAAQTQVQTEFAIVMSEVSDRVEVDSVVVNVQYEGTDTTLVFINEDGSLPEDRLQFTLTVSEGTPLDISYNIYVNDEAIKTGSAQYDAGEFDPLDTDQQDSELNDSLLNVLDPLEVLEPLRISFLDPNQIVTEGENLNIAVGFKDNGSVDTLEAPCQIDIQSDQLNDLGLDTTLTFEAGSVVETSKTLTINALTDQLVEGEESFGLSLKSNCTQIQESNTDSISLTLLDSDSLFLEFSQDSLESSESDTLSTFQIKVRFSPAEAQLAQTATAELGFESAISSALYQLEEPLTISLTTDLKNNDSLTYNLELMTANEDIEPHRQISLSLQSLSESVQIGETSEFILSLKNDDFKYYFATDVGNSQVHIIDHQGQHLKSKAFTNVPNHIYNFSKDSLVVVTDGGVYYWNLPLDTLIQFAGGSDSYLLRGGVGYSYLFSDPQSIYFSTGAGGGAAGFFETIATPNNRLNFGANPEGEVEASYFSFDSSKIHIDNIATFAGETFESSEVEFLRGMGDLIYHSNGKAYVSLHEQPPCLLPCRTYGYVMEVDADSLKPLTSLVDWEIFDSNDYPQLLLKEPQGMVEDTDGNIALVDRRTQALIQIDINTGEPTLLTDLKLIASTTGLFDLVQLSTDVEILP